MMAASGDCTPRVACYRESGLEGRWYVACDCHDPAAPRSVYVSDAIYGPFETHQEAERMSTLHAKAAAARAAEGSGRLDDYQRQAGKTAVHPVEYEDLRDPDTNLTGLTYAALKLCSEAGEVADVVGKAMRDQDGRIPRETVGRVTAELGDVLWYVARLAALLDVELSEVARVNLVKLRDRAGRGTLRGSGDDR